MLWAAEWLTHERAQAEDCCLVDRQKPLRGRQLMVSEAFDVDKFLKQFLKQSV